VKNFTKCANIALAFSKSNILMVEEPSAELASLSNN
jgi:hypothetical protein